jgi:hypothetical protein
MSLRQEVVDLIEDLGEGSADDLLPLLPGFTEKQIAVALSNARFRGLLVCVSESKHYGAGRAQTRSRYVMAPEPEPPPCPKPVASVWELGQRALEAT